MPTFYLVMIVILLFIAVSLAIFFFIRNSQTDKQQSESILNLERRLTDLMSNQLKEIRGSVDNTSRDMHEQIRSFTKEATEIRENIKQIQEKVADVSTFQEIFKAPKLRGSWGEAHLEHIISQHFPKELYQSQYSFSSGEAVDFILRLPNGKIVPIDSKFPTENFQKMTEAATETEKEFFKKSFLEDVKGQIVSISQKYILPGEGTTDFALMFIPAEAVYYEIINNLAREVDISSFAQSKKVIITSPNTIYLTLRTIEHWFKDTQISKQTQGILKRLGKIYHDAEKLMDEFRKLGNHLKNASSAYDSSEKRLSLFEEKVEKLIEIDETKKLPEQTNEQ